jgi:hypothetical protein
MDRPGRPGRPGRQNKKEISKTVQVEKLPFGVPVWIIDEFLAPEDASRCLQECIDLRKVYQPAFVGAGKTVRVDGSIRQNDVVMLDSIFRSARDRSDILTLVDARINSEECNKLWHEGYTLFDTINYRTWNESVLSRYGKCNFYGRHQDTIFNADAPNEKRRRLVTMVLYFNIEPEQFKGGDLSIWDGGGTDAKIATIKPRHNRAIVFPSFAHHKVDKVDLPGDAPFSAGRFSLNRWMGFQ